MERNQKIELGHDMLKRGLEDLNERSQTKFQETDDKLEGVRKIQKEVANVKCEMRHKLNADALLT